MAKIIYDNYDDILTAQLNEYQKLNFLMLISKILISEYVPLSIKS